MEIKKCKYLPEHLQYPHGVKRPASAYSMSVLLLQTLSFQHSQTTAKLGKHLNYNYIITKPKY